MALYEADMLDDVAEEEAEGAAEAFGDGFESYEEFDEYDEFDEGEAYDEFDEFDELEAMDEYEEFDEFGDDEFEAYDEFEDAFDEDASDTMLAYALAAEDEDEFFGKLFRGIKRIAKKVAPVVGRVARVAAPILSKIPLPYAQLGARAARLLGRLRMEGASEEEALDAFAELAARDPRALPIVATIGARTILKSKGKQMSLAARKRAVKDVKTAAKTLVRTHGTKSIRALPKIVRSAKKMAARKGIPVKVRTKVVKAAAKKVVRSPAMTRRLSKPKVKAIATVKKSGAAHPAIGARSYTIPGPTRITISAA